MHFNLYLCQKGTLFLESVHQVTSESTKNMHEIKVRPQVNFTSIDGYFKSVNRHFQEHIGISTTYYMPASIYT